METIRVLLMFLWSVFIQSTYTDQQIKSDTVTPVILIPGLLCMILFIYVRNTCDCDSLPHYILDQPMIDDAPSRL